MLLEVAGEHVDGLLGDLQLVGQVRLAQAVQAGVAEHRQVGGIDVGVAVGHHAFVHLVAHPVGGHAEHCSHARAVIGASV